MAATFLPQKYLELEQEREDIRLQLQMMDQKSARSRELHYQFDRIHEESLKRLQNTFASKLDKAKQRNEAILDRVRKLDQNKRTKALSENSSVRDLAAAQDRYFKQVMERSAQWHNQNTLRKKKELEELELREKRMKKDWHETTEVLNQEERLTELLQEKRQRVQAAEMELRRRQMARSMLRREGEQRAKEFSEAISRVEHSVALGLEEDAFRSMYQKGQVGEAGPEAGGGKDEQPAVPETEDLGYLGYEGHGGQGFSSTQASEPGGWMGHDRAAGTTLPFQTQFAEAVAEGSDRGSTAPKPSSSQQQAATTQGTSAALEEKFSGEELAPEDTATVSYVDGGVTLTGDDGWEEESPNTKQEEGRGGDENVVHVGGMTGSMTAGNDEEDEDDEEKEMEAAVDPSMEEEAEEPQGRGGRGGILDHSSVASSPGMPSSIAETETPGDVAPKAASPRNDDLSSTFEASVVSAEPEAQSPAVDRVGSLPDEARANVPLDGVGQTRHVEVSSMSQSTMNLASGTGAKELEVPAEFPLTSEQYLQAFKALAKHLENDDADNGLYSNTMMSRTFEEVVTQSLNDTCKGLGMVECCSGIVLIIADKHAELVPEELRNRPKLSEEDIDHHHDFDNEDADISKLWSAWRSHLRDVLDQDQATEKDLISSFLPCFDKAPAFRHANKLESMLRDLVKRPGAAGARTTTSGSMLGSMSGSMAPTSTPAQAPRPQALRTYSVDSVSDTDDVDSPNTFSGGASLLNSSLAGLGGMGPSLGNSFGGASDSGTGSAPIVMGAGKRKKPQKVNVLDMNF